MINNLGFGLQIRTSEFVPEFKSEPVEDWEERLEVMTAYHILLDLIPLQKLEPCVYVVQDYIICHPNNYEKVLKGVSQ